MNVLAQHEYLQGVKLPTTLDFGVFVKHTKMRFYNSCPVIRCYLSAQHLEKNQTTPSLEDGQLWQAREKQTCALARRLFRQTSKFEAGDREFLVGFHVPNVCYPKSKCHEASRRHQKHPSLESRLKYCGMLLFQIPNESSRSNAKLPHALLLSHNGRCVAHRRILQVSNRDQDQSQCNNRSVVPRKKRFETRRPTDA